MQHFSIPQILFFGDLPRGWVLWEHILNNAVQVSPIGTWLYVWSSFSFLVDEHIKVLGR